MIDSAFLNGSDKGILIPEEVAWDFVINGSVLESIHSKHKRKFLRKLPEIFQENNLSTEVHLVTEDLFSQWLAFYEKVHSSKGFKILASHEWLTQKLEMNRQPELLILKQNGEWMGAKMYSYDDSGIYFSFKSTSDAVDAHLNSGLILDYFSFERAKELGYSVCKMGREKSIHGIDSKLSLYEYKVSLGLQIRSAANTKYIKVLFPKDPPAPSMVFLAGEKGKELLYYIYTDEKDLQSVDKEKPVNMGDYSVVIQ